MGLFDKLTGGPKKREAFYDSYADSHNLTRSNESIPEVTKNVEDLDTVERFDGELAPGVRGSIVLVEKTIQTSRVVVNSDLDNEIRGTFDGSSRTESSTGTYPSTVIIIPVQNLPESVSALAVKRNFNKQSGDEAVYGDLHRVALSGVDLDPRYWVYANENANPAEVSSLFSPSFSAWLNGRDERFFSFEIGEGTLVIKHPKHPKDAEGLDAQVSEACEAAGSLQAA